MITAVGFACGKVSLCPVLRACFILRKIVAEARVLYIALSFGLTPCSTAWMHALELRLSTWHRRKLISNPISDCQPAEAKWDLVLFRPPSPSSPPTSRCLYANMATKGRRTPAEASTPVARLSIAAPSVWCDTQSFCSSKAHTNDLSFLVCSSFRS